MVPSTFMACSLIDSVTSHKDLGITLDNHPKFHNHSTEVTANLKAIIIFWEIKSSIMYLEPDMLVKLLITLVHCTPEYGNLV